MLQELDEGKVTGDISLEFHLQLRNVTALKEKLFFLPLLTLSTSRALQAY